MVVSALRYSRRSTDLRRLSLNLQLAFSTLPSTLASPSLDPLFEQFLQSGGTPSSPRLQKLQRRAVFIGLGAAIKTSAWLPSLGPLSLGSHPHHVARILGSFPDSRAAIAFFRYALRDTSANTLRSCCVLARLLLRNDPCKRTLAEEVVACVVEKMSFTHGGTVFDLVNGSLTLGDYGNLSLLFGAFVRRGMTMEAFAMLKRIRNRGLRLSLRSIGCFIKLLFRRCELGQIWKIFREMLHRGPRPSVRSFNDLILGFCLRGNISIGESLLYVMHKFQHLPDACSFNIVIKAHCLYGRSSDAFELCQTMREAGCLPNVKTFNILIHALCREGRMIEAQKLFDEMPVRGVEVNTVTYNVLLDGYVKAGQINKACSVYKDMIIHGLSPDCYTFNILVAGHLKFRWDERERFLSSLLKTDNFVLDSALDVVISGCCWEGQLDKARELLDHALEEGTIPGVVAFNALLAAYSRYGLAEGAFQLYNIMRDVGLAPSAPTSNYLLMCLCEKGRNLEARELLVWMMESGSRINKSTFTIVLDSSFRIGDVEGAQRIWNSMKRYGILPDVIAFSAYINGLCNAGHINEAHDVFYKMRQGQLVPNTFVYNSLINGSVQDGNLTDAWDLERKMFEDGLAPDVVTKNILIKGLCREKRLEDANDIFMDMHSSGLVPDVVTYNTMISAYCRMQDISNALNAISRMTSEGCDPDITTYNIWIHALSSCNKMNQAMRLIDDLVSRSIIPNTVTYNTLMNGICAEVHHSKTVQDRILVLTGKLIKMAFSPNIVTINLLLSHLCREGLAGKALIWEQILSQASVHLTHATYNILKWARSCMQYETPQAEEHVTQFLESLVYMVFDSICNKKRLIHNSLIISSIIEHFPGVASTNANQMTQLARPLP